TITEDEGLSKGSTAVQEQRLPGQGKKTQVDAENAVADMPKPSQRTVREKKGAEPPRHAASSDRMPGVQHAVAEADANGAVRQAETLAVSTRTSGELSEQLSNADISTVRPAASGSGENQSNGVVRELTGQPQRAGAATQTKADEPGQVDGARFVQRVARAFRAVGDRGGNVRLRLSPPELGSLRLDISVRNGAMTAKVEAETATARNLLLDNLPALRERLAEQNIKVEQFDVSLSDRSPGGLPDQTARHAEDRRQGQGGGNSQLHGEGENEEQMLPESHVPNRPGEGDQLNVVV
ncbi:MAG: flagellar hook-length control protein FliK, partial [Thermoguttaceae bacterium]